MPLLIIVTLHILISGIHELLHAHIIFFFCLLTYLDLLFLCLDIVL